MSDHGIPAPVGLGVGVSVGLEVGSSVGRSLGRPVGLAVGGPVGRPVGRSVGLEVGNPVGSLAGSFVGRPVGSLVGSALGRLVGLTVGPGLGSPVVTSPTSSTTTVRTPLSTSAYILPASSSPRSLRRDAAAPPVGVPRCNVATTTWPAWEGDGMPSPRGDGT